MKNSVIKILVPDGNPNGLKVIEMSGYSLMAFSIPRSDIKLFSELEESTFPALYLLLGEREESDKPVVYIGQTQDGVRRLTQHDSNTPDWNFALVFTGDKGMNVSYLETKAVESAKEANRYQIKNGPIPSGPKLDRIASIENDEYFFKIKFIVNLLGMPLFQPLPQKDNVKKELYTMEANESLAVGTLLPDNKFIVFQGGSGLLRDVKSFKGGYAWSLRQRLIESGEIVTSKEGRFVLKGDYVFPSPSAAAAFFAGLSINGWTAWKDTSGKTLDENVRRGVI